MTLTLDFLGNGRVAQWTLTPDGVAREVHDDYRPTLFIGDAPNDLYGRTGGPEPTPPSRDRLSDALAELRSFLDGQQAVADLDVEGVDEQARETIESYTTLPDDVDPIGKQRAWYAALKAARDRALVVVLAYTAVRVGEFLRDPDDPRRRGVRWEDIELEDGSMDVYRKKQQWDAASLPDPVISPLRSYRKLMDPPTERWPAFPTFDQRTLAELVQEELADRGEQSGPIDERCDEYARDLMLALDEDIRPPSITTDGARSMLQGLTEAAEIDIDHPKHDYLAPHGGRRGMGEVLVRAFGYTVAARYLDNSEDMVRERYSHIEAGELGDVATEALNEIDSLTPRPSE